MQEISVPGTAADDKITGRGPGRFSDGKVGSAQPVAQHQETAAVLNHSGEFMNIPRNHIRVARFWHILCFINVKWVRLLCFWIDLDMPIRIDILTRENDKYYLP